METTFFELPDDLRNIIWRRARFASARESVEQRLAGRMLSIKSKLEMMRNKNYSYVCQTSIRVNKRKFLKIYHSVRTFRLSDFRATQIDRVYEFATVSFAPIESVSFSFRDEIGFGFGHLDITVGFRQEFSFFERLQLFVLQTLSILVDSTLRV